MDWKTPKIEIGGVPIMEQGFQWSLIPGTYPYTRSFMLPKGSINTKMKALKNPTSIKIEVTGGTKGEAEIKTLEFKKVFLLEPKETDPYNVLWTIADTRFNWRGKKLYYSYNKTRIKNEKGFGSPIPETDPASVRRPFDAFKVGRYISWTVKDDGSPYNMREIVEMELAKTGVTVFQNVEADQGAYTIENVEAEGEDVYSGLYNLLAKSRLTLGIKRDGSIYVYSLDYYDANRDALLQQVVGKYRTRPGVLYNQDKKRVRPKKINVLFEQKKEIRVIAASSKDVNRSKPIPIYTNPPVWDVADIATIPPKVIACENVIRVNYPIKSLDDTRYYEIGEYVPMWEYLKAIDISEQLVREGWFSSILERIYARLIEDRQKVVASYANEQYAQKIIANIRQHYRKTYQIDLFWIDRMKSWESRRVGIIDNYSRFSPPSPLWADYCIISKMRHPTLAKRKALWKRQAYNWIIENEDPLRNKPTLGTIVPINMELGIFGVNYPPLIDQVVAEIIPSSLDESKMPYTSASNDIAMMEQCNLKSTFKLETLISVVWNVAEADDFASKKKYFIISLDYSNEKGEGPDLEYLSRLEYARNQTKEYDNGGIEKLIPIPRNGGILEAIAVSEGAKLINQFKDRLSGIATFAGFAKDIELYGHMKSIVYSFTSGAGLETTVDMRDIPPAKLREEFMTQSMINYLYKQVPRAENINENTKKE